MVIQALSYSRTRKGEFVEITFDDDSKMSVDAELAVRYRLKKGLDLSDEDKAQLDLDNQRLLARRSLVRYLAPRKKSAREAEQYLERLGFGEEAITAALEAGVELKLIDDAEYAAAYVRTQQRSSSKGPRAIQQELRMRGVAKDLVEESVAAASEPELQRQRALAAGEKKLRTLRDPDVRKNRQKLYGYLLRQGYDGDIAREVTEQLLAHDENALE